MIPVSDNPAHHVLVFDSGVGGLSVSAEIRKRMPELHQSYLADDAFRPYGEKTEAAIRARLPGLLAPVCDMLNVDLVVVACNTASTAALPSIRDALDIPVVGVVPAIKPAAASSRSGHIAVLGTLGTVKRRYVDKLIKDFASDKTVVLQGSLALVSEAEAKLSGKPVNRNVLRREVDPIFEQDAQVDTIVLACTHFPLLVEDLRSVAPEGVQWIDSGAAIARRVHYLLRDIRPKDRLPFYQTAFLTGPVGSSQRASAFHHFGFERLVSLPD